MERIPAEIKEALSGTLVVPSRQRAHAVRLAVAAERLADGRRAWESPQVLSLEAWLVREIEARAHADAAMPRLLSPAEDWWLWRQSTSELALEAGLEDPIALADGLRHAATLAWQFAVPVPGAANALGAQGRLLAAVLQRVQARCRELNAAPAWSLAATVADSLPGDSAVFAGFTEPFALLRDRAKLRPSERRQSQSPRTGPPFSLVVASDEWNELERIAGWCDAHLRRDRSARLFVMLQNSSAACERLAMLIRQRLAPSAWLHDTAEAALLVGIEGGDPLLTLPMVAHALRSLELLDGERLEFDELSQWLSTPLWKTPSAQLRARVELALRRHAAFEWDMSTLMGWLGSAPAPVGDAARTLEARLTNAARVFGGARASPRTWSERFGAALHELGWPGEETPDSAAQQIRMRFHALLDEFGQLAGAVPTMSSHEAVRAFRELAARTAFRPADGDPLVTIARRLVDPVVRYEGIWIAGLHAEAFPRPAQPDPYLPLERQIAAGMPGASAAGRLEQSRALLTSWRAASDDVVLSHAARARDLELAPSPLLARCLSQAAREQAAGSDTAEALGPTIAAEIPSVATGTLTLDAGSWLPERCRRSDRLEWVDDPRGLPWLTDRPLPGGTSALELQSACAFRAYAQLRLGAGELATPEPGVPATQRGKLLHLALQRLWIRLVDHAGLQSRPPAELLELIDECVRKAAAEVLPASFGARTQQAAQEARAEREIRRARRLIAQLCALEVGRPAFRVLGTELERTLSLAGARIDLRIDRVDRLDSGGWAICDYKSGQIGAQEWYDARPSHPQLLAYLLSLGSEVVALAMIQVTAREVRFKGICSPATRLLELRPVRPLDTSDLRSAWTQRRQQWQDHLERLAGAFVAGRAEVDPRPQACLFCPTRPICRISERRLTLDDRETLGMQDPGAERGGAND